MPHKISYREKGQGPLTILLHGYGGSVLHWDQIVDRLEDRFRLVIPNLSHLYMSSNKLVFQEQVEKFCQFIDLKYPDEKMNIVGISYGAAISGGFALKRPHRLEKLVLINPLMPYPVDHFKTTELIYFFNLPMNPSSLFMILSTPIGKSFLRRTAEIFRDARLEGATNVEHLSGRKLQFVAQVISHFSWILKNEDWSIWADQLPQLPHDKLVIYDKEDQLFDLDSYRAFVHQLLNVQSVETTGAGHLAIKTRPESIAHQLLSFL